MPEGLREDPYHWTELPSLNKDYYYYYIGQIFELVHYMCPAALEYPSVEMVSVCTGWLWTEGPESTLVDTRL